MALIKQRKLHLSLIRQRDISDCGPACLASVCGFYGLHVTVAAIRHLALTDQKGTSVLGIVDAAIVLGLDAKGIRTEYGSLGLTTLPAIVHVIIDEKISHYMVLVKVNTKGVLVMDPAAGKLKKLTEEEFRKIWTGVMIMMLPGDKFFPNEKISDLTRIKEIVSPFKKLLILATVCAAIVSFLGISMSVYVKEIVDEILVKKDKLLLEIISAMAIILLLIQFLVSVTRNLLVLKTGRSINSSLIMAYYRHVLKLPQSFFNRMQVGEILSRINDAVKITTFIHDVAVNIIVDILIVIFSLAMMFYYNWRITLLILAIVPFYGLLYYISNRINKHWQRRIAVAGAELDASLVESLGIAQR
jgi:ATP-binding cassette subfamily B protein